MTGRDDEDYWFEPKRHGRGFGMPIKPQGWLLLGGLMAFVLAALPLSTISPIAYALLTFAAIGAFILIGARKTRGGLGGRSEKDD
jgi:hypothetical protein